MKQLLEQKWTADLWDRINQRNFGALAAGLSTTNFALVSKMLEPRTGSNQPVLEKQKAAIVQMMLNMIDAGSDMDVQTPIIAACENSQLVCYGAGQQAYANLIDA